MTKFEQVGVTIQQLAYSPENAKRQFLKSCEICCNRGICVECERCAIANANKLVLAAFAAANK